MKNHSRFNDWWNTPVTDVEFVVMLWAMALLLAYYFNYTLPWLARMVF